MNIKKIGEIYSEKFNDACVRILHYIEKNYELLNVVKNTAKERINRMPEKSYDDIIACARKNVDTCGNLSLQWIQSVWDKSKVTVKDKEMSVKEYCDKIVKNCFGEVCYDVIAHVMHSWVELHKAGMNVVVKRECMAFVDGLINVQVDR